MVWIKLKEWVTAVKLERSYTKEEIMNMYMNSVFFGSGAYGIQAASQTFFGKDPIDLTVEEAVGELVDIPMDDSMENGQSSVEADAVE